MPWPTWFCAEGGTWPVASAGAAQPASQRPERGRATAVEPGPRFAPRARARLVWDQPAPSTEGDSHVSHESGQRTGEEPRRRRPCEGAAPGPCRALRPHSEASHGRFTDPGAPRRPHRAPEWESSAEGPWGGGVQFAFYCPCSRVRVTRYTFKTWGSGRGALQREATGAGGVRGCLSAGRLGGGGPRSRVGAECALSVCVGMAVP